MFEKLLGQMLSGGFGNQRKRRSSRGLGLSSSVKSQLGVGAIGLAIAAWEHFKGKSAATGAQSASPFPTQSSPPPPPSAQAPALTETSDREADAAHLIRSMIAAAHADGAIDAEERSAILERAMEAGLDAETQKFLMGELRAPATMDQIVAATPDGLRLECYAAALIAISVDTQAERDYLDRLGNALGLDAADRQRVQEQVGA